MIEPTSRYAAIADATHEVADSDGRTRTLVYKRRRFVPDGSSATTLVEHRVAQGERLDTIAARYLGDPTQFWKLCDANGVMHPAELEELGRTLRIALPGF